MEVYFLDVGQGSCHLILLGNQEAIVIDGGPKTDRILLRALQRYSIQRIRALVTTHSHADHTGGATELLTSFAGRIDKIWFLKDDRLFQSPYWKRLRQLIDDEEIEISQLTRIELTDNPRPIYQSEDAVTRLSIYSPGYAENLFAQEQRNANATSAILALEVGEKKIIFAADSVLDQWKTIREQLGKPLKCEVIAVPHHGGKVGAVTAEDLKWLYQKAISAETAIISVGTSNQHDHPSAGVVQAIRSSSATVMCTQITKRCCNDLESLRPGVQRPGHPLQRSRTTSDLTAAGKSRNVACAGTVVVDVSAEKIEVRGLKSHQQGVDRLPVIDEACPLCRCSHGVDGTASCSG